QRVALGHLLADGDEGRGAGFGRQIRGPDHGRGHGAGVVGRVAGGGGRGGGRCGRGGGGRLRGLRRIDGGGLHHHLAAVLGQLDRQPVILAIFTLDLQFGQLVAVQKLGQRLDEGGVFRV